MERISQYIHTSNFIIYILNVYNFHLSNILEYGWVVFQMVVWLVAWYAQNPGFALQHSTNQMLWHTPGIHLSRSEMKIGGLEVQYHPQLHSKFEVRLR